MGCSHCRLSLREPPLSLVANPSSSNDPFANAIRLAGSTIQTAGSNLNGSLRYPHGRRQEKPPGISDVRQEADLEAAGSVERLPEALRRDKLISFQSFCRSHMDGVYR